MNDQPKKRGPYTRTAPLVPRRSTITVKVSKETFDAFALQCEMAGLSQAKLFTHWVKEAGQ